jgi:hypothetical protein
LRKYRLKRDAVTPGSSECRFGFLLPLTQIVKYFALAPQKECGGTEQHAEGKAGSPSLHIATSSNAKPTIVLYKITAALFSEASWRACGSARGWWQPKGMIPDCRCFVNYAGMRLPEEMSCM